jgi:hypothetical protein
MKSKRDGLLRKTIPALIFVFSVIRLTYYIYDFSLNTLQVDFSAYYTAGEALNNNLSPYENNIKHDPPIWDGTNDHGHSRFLYPPLVAMLFQPVALIPYFWAKIIWNSVSVLAIILSLYITTRIFPLKNATQALLLGMCVCLYFPLLPHMERGQIDAVTLFLLTSSFYLLNGVDKTKGWLAGGLIAAATLLKLHIVYVLPFLFLKRRWHAIAGFLATWLVLFLLSMATPGNRSLLQDYVFHQLPRIAAYGTPDHGDVLLDPAMIHDQIEGLPDGYSTKDGRIYQVSSLDFSGNATLVRPLYEIPGSLGWNINHTSLSLMLFIGLMSLWMYFFASEEASPEADFMYWQAVLALILLTAPLTHVMNTVWLLPMFIVLVSRFDVTQTVFVMLVAGMVLLALPDATNTGTPAPIASLPDLKYVIGEVLVLAGCLMYLTYNKPRFN